VLEQLQKLNLHPEVCAMDQGVVLNLNRLLMCLQAEAEPLREDYRTHLAALDALDKVWSLY
jgi:hypothetical protein